MTSLYCHWRPDVLLNGHPVRVPFELDRKTKSNLNIFQNTLAEKK